jgi:hypothetical protein
VEKLPAPRLPVTSTHVKGLTQAATQEMPSDFPRFGYPEERLDALIDRAARAYIPHEGS